MRRAVLAAALLVGGGVALAAPAAQARPATVEQRGTTGLCVVIRGVPYSYCMPYMWDKLFR